MDKRLQTLNNELVPCAEGKPLWRSLSALSQASARELLPEHLAYKYSVLPMAIINTKTGEPVLSVISSEKSIPLDELRFVTGSRLINETAPTSVVERAIVSAYFKTDNLLEKEPQPYLILLLKKAIAADCSDIHIEPVDGEKYLVRLRIDGVLQKPISELGKENSERLVRHLKARADLDMTIHDLPQESVFSEKVGNLRIRMRLSILPTGSGQSVVIRIHQLDDIPSFKDLGLDQQQVALIRQSLNSDRGMVLVSGPTGSGKSTLLYSCLRYLAESGKKVIAVEDPIEQTIEKITQVEVNNAGKRGFVDYLPAVLRQDPDVLMIGEIRESKTAKLAFEASLTGHLVLTSVHGGSLREILLRLKSLGITNNECLASFRLVVTQRLVARNCKHCLGIDNSQSSIKRFFSFSENEKLYSSSGCKFCRESKVSGRIGVYEIKSFLGGGAAANKSYYPIFHSLRNLLISGQISAATALSALGLELDSPSTS